MTQTLDQDTLPRPAVEGAAVRGPFRPAAWLNARRRRSRRLAPLAFRMVDVTAVAVATLATMGGHAETPSLIAMPWALWS
jgi:hypothetical protein